MDGETLDQHFRRLKPFLEDKAWDVRRDTIEEISSYGHLAEKFGKAFTDMALVDGVKDVRLAAARAIPRLGESAALLAQELANATAGDDRNVKRCALEALATLGGGELVLPHLPQIALKLKDKNSGVRRAACQALGSLGNALLGHAEQMLEMMTEDRDSEVRRAIVDALGGLPQEEARQFVQQFAEKLEDTGWQVRRSAANALANCGSAAASSTKDLRHRALHDEEREVQRAAAIALGALSRAGLPLGTEDLVQTLQDDASADVRRRAAEVLEQQGEGASGSAGRILDALKREQDAGVREAALLAFGALGRDAAGPYSQHLLGFLLHDPSIDVQCAAVKVLCAVGETSKLSVEQLVSALHHERPDVRWGAAEALALLGEDGAAHLVKALADESWSVRRAAAEALSKLGKEAAPHTRAKLLVFLFDIDSDVRRAAVEAFGFQGEAAADSACHVAELITDDNKYVRSAVARTLGQMGDGKYAECLADALRSTDLPLRREAIQALGKLGKAAAPFREQLEASRDRDVDEEVRKLAHEVCERLGF